MKFGRPMSIEREKRLKAFKVGDQFVYVETTAGFSTLQFKTVLGFSYKIRQGGRIPKLGAHHYEYIAYDSELYLQWAKLARPQDILRDGIHMGSVKGDSDWIGIEADWQALRPVLSSAPCKHCAGYGFKTSKGDELLKYRHESTDGYFEGFSFDSWASLPFSERNPEPKKPPTPIAQNIKLCAHCFGLG